VPNVDTLPPAFEIFLSDKNSGIDEKFDTIILKSNTVKRKTTAL
jgi:hypothetical protein